MTKIGVVGIPGGWSSERLADVVARRTGERYLIDPGAVSLDLSRGRATHDGVDLMELDGLIIKKTGARYSPRHLDRLEVLRFVAERGVPTFSPPTRIIRVLDRLACTVTLRAHDIPMPPTVITEDLDRALDAVRDLERVVLKPLFSTKARGMEVVESASPEAEAQVRLFKEQNPVLYIQAVIDLPDRDLGVAFLGGEYLGTYARVRRHDSWNTTTRSGGRYMPHDPSDEVIELARRAQAPFGLDFTCVDVAECASGPVVFEVSAFGGFRGLSEACGIDAAERVVDYVCERTRHDA
jgi:ribosomal protein S6--L-glutamate ligase